MLSTAWAALSTKAGRIAAAIAAGALAVAVVLLRAFRAGKAAEKARQAKINLEIKHDQLRAAADRPRSRDELAGRMRDGRW